MPSSFTLYTGWAQRHASIRLWYSEHLPETEILVQEVNGSDWILARVQDDEFSKVTSVDADYRLRKLVRLLAHRILESVDPDTAAEIHPELKADENLAGCLDVNVEAIETFVDEHTST